jgi:protein-S-isoprenylcysteine O-methyltransferase Ste14
MRFDPRCLELKIPPLLVLALCAGGVWASWRYLPALALPHHEALFSWVSAGLATAGAAISLAGVLSFRRAGTTTNPLHPEATVTFVRAGAYRFSRNPMYLGFLLILVGVSLYCASLLAPVVVGAFVGWIDRFQILPEERMLRSKFGAEYDDYARRVRRWL